MFLTLMLLNNVMSILIILLFCLNLMVFHCLIGLILGWLFLGGFDDGGWKGIYRGLGGVGVGGIV